VTTRTAMTHSVLQGRRKACNMSAHELTVLTTLTSLSTVDHYTLNPKNIALQCNALTQKVKLRRLLHRQKQVCF
jgi:hypothetical protein